MRILIGSRAQKHWDSNFPRNPKDWDYISGEEITGTDSKFCPSFKLVAEHFNFPEILPEDGLFTLKLSHSFWPGVWFEKTLFDLCYYQKNRKVKCIDELFWPLYKDAEKRYGKKRAYLDKSNEDFFNDGVKSIRIYNHDSIHESIAYYDEPLYLKIKTDKTKALTSWNLFLNLSREDQLRLIKEEAYVIAAERYKLIKETSHLNPRVCYGRALKMLLTQLWKGHWAKFIAENYLALTEKDSYDWWSKFENARNNGKILKL